MKREIKVHIIALLLLFFTTIIACFGIIANPGYIVYGDFQVPTSVENFQKVHIPLWNENGQTGTFDNLNRLLSRLPFFLLNIFFNIHMDILMKVLVFSTLFLAGAGMYFLVFFYLNNRFKRISSNLLLFTCFLSSLIYMFNPWSIFRIQHFSLWLGYSLLPLFILFFFLSLKHYKLKYIVVAAAVFSVMSTTPHYIANALIVCFGYILFKFILTKSKDNLLKDIWVFTKILFVYVLFSSYWIIPYVFATFATGFIGPTYSVSTDVIDLLSRNSSFLNAIRMLDTWWVLVDPMPISKNLQHIWLVSSFLIPILAFSVFLKKKKEFPETLFFGFLSLIFIFAATGTYVYETIYHFIVFGAPFSEYYGWLFRGPNKWGGLIALCYSILVGYSITSITTHLASKFRFKLIDIFIVFGTIFFLGTLVFIWNTNVGYFYNLYSPIEIPNSLHTINDWLKSDSDLSKAIWYPIHQGNPTSWAPNKSIGIINVRSSGKPTIAPFTSLSRFYINYLDQKLRSGTDAYFLSNYLSVPNVKYLIYLNDSLGSEFSKTLNYMHNQEKFQLAYQDDFIYVFQNDFLNEQITKKPKNMLITSDLNKISSLSFLDLDFMKYNIYFANQRISNLDILNMFDTILLDFNDFELDYTIGKDDVVISPYAQTNRHNPSVVWSKAAVNDPSHGSWHFYLERFNLDNWDLDYGLGLVHTWGTGIPKQKFSPESYLYNLNTLTFENFNPNAMNISKRKEKLEVSLSKGHMANWNVVSTNRLNLTENKKYRILTSVSAKNSNKLHSKISFYNASGNEIRSQFIFGGTNSTFDRTSYHKDVIPPEKTTFARVQFWKKQNADFDSLYKVTGLSVIDLTNEKNPNELELEFSIKDSGVYDLYIRSFKSNAGGTVSVQVDEQENKFLSTKSSLSRFKWERLSTFSLEKGIHTVKISNIEGFNAINILSLVKKNQISAGAPDTILDKNLFFVLEAESDFNHESSVETLNEFSNGLVLKTKMGENIWQDIAVPKSAYYEIEINCEGEFDFFVNDIVKNVACENGLFTIDTVYLEKGTYTLSLDTKSKTGIFDVLTLKSWLNDNLKNPELLANNSVIYEKINPTKYTVQIRAEEPFMLSFAEAYDPLWEAKIKVNGTWKKYEPIPLYSVINGFWIDEVGEYEVIIHYKPQQWFYIGAAISILTLTIILGYLIGDFFAKRHRKKPKPQYKGHAFTEAMIDMYRKGKIDVKELKGYLKRYYSDRAIKFIIKDIHSEQETKKSLSTLMQKQRSNEEIKKTKRKK